MPLYWALYNVDIFKAACIQTINLTSSVKKWFTWRIENEASLFRSLLFVCWWANVQGRCAFAYGHFLFLLLWLSLYLLALCCYYLAFRILFEFLLIFSLRSRIIFTWDFCNEISYQNDKWNVKDWCEYMKQHCNIQSLYHLYYRHKHNRSGNQ